MPRPKNGESSRRGGHRGSKRYNRNGEDRSVATSSTASTFTGIRSILDRRRRAAFRELPAARENADEEGDAGGSARRSGPPRKPHPPFAGKSRRSQERKRSGRITQRGRQFRQMLSMVLLVLIGLASNWLANHILRAMLIEEAGLPGHGVDLYSSDSGGVGGSPGMKRTGLGVNENRGDMIQKPFISNPTIDLQRNELSSDRTKDEPGNERRGKHFTDRFASLRRRLLPLYSEAPPLNETQSPGSSVSSHPLYNSQSPQYNALDWLAKVDGLELPPSDPGLIQRYSLAVVYFATGGPPVRRNTDLSRRRRGPWRNPTNFLAPTHECDWKGRIIDGRGRGGGIRRCDKNKTVVEISIYNELSGTLPTELGRLWNLRTLYLGRNNITGTIPTEIGMIQKLSSLSLQHNDLSGTIPEHHLKNLLTLRALQVEGNERLSGNLHRHSLLCQMRNKYRGPTPKDQERYTGRRVLRILTATCIPSGSSSGVSSSAFKDRLECACCTECFGKTRRDSIFSR